MGILRDRWNFVKLLRVEPVLFIFIFSVNLYNIGAGNLVNQKICYPDEPPHGVLDPCNKTEALKEISVLNTVRSLVRETLPGVVVLIAGSWRDHTGLSRPLILLAHVGEVVTVCTDLIAANKWRLSPWSTVLGGSIVAGLTGSRALITMTAIAYISDNSSDESRTARVSIVMLAILGGIAAALATGGIILGVLGYNLFFIMILIGYLLSFSLALLLVKDGQRREQSIGGSPFDSLKRIMIIFQDKPNNFTIWSFILASCVLTGMLIAESNVSFLFLQKILLMTTRDAGFIGSYKMLVSLFGAVIIIPILKRCFKLSDFTVGFICTVPSAISCFGMAFSTTEVQVYIFATFDLMRIVLLSTLLSQITRSVKNEEVGIYSSFLGFGEAFLPLGLSPFYTYVFDRTLTTLPGAFYIISGCSVVLSAILIVLSSFHYEVPSKEEQETVVSSNAAERT